MEDSQESNTGRVEDPESVSSTSTGANAARAAIKHAFVELRYDVEQYLSNLGLIEGHFLNVVPENGEESYHDHVEATLNRVQGILIHLNQQSITNLQKQVVQKLSRVYPRLPQPALPAVPNLISVTTDASSNTGVPGAEAMRERTSSIDDRSSSAPSVREAHPINNEAVGTPRTEPFFPTPESPPAVTIRQVERDPLFTTTTPKPAHSATRLERNRRKLILSKTSVQKVLSPAGIKRKWLMCSKCHKRILRRKLQAHIQGHAVSSYVSQIRAAKGQNKVRQEPESEQSSLDTSNLMPVSPRAPISVDVDTGDTEQPCSSSQDSSEIDVEKIVKDDRTPAARATQVNEPYDELIEFEIPTSTTTGAVADNSADVNVDVNAHFLMEVDTSESFATDQANQVCTRGQDVANAVKVENTEAAEADSQQLDLRISLLPANPNDIQLIDNEIPGPSRRTEFLHPVVAASGSEGSEPESSEVESVTKGEVECVYDPFDRLCEDLVEKRIAEERHPESSGVILPTHDKNKDPKLKLHAVVRLTRLADIIEDELDESHFVDVSGCNNSSENDEDLSDDVSELSKDEANKRLLEAELKKLLRSEYRKPKPVNKKTDAESAYGPARREKRKMGPRSKVPRAPSDYESELDTPDSSINLDATSVRFQGPSAPERDSVLMANANETIPLLELEDGIVSGPEENEDIDDDEDEDNDVYRQQLLEDESGLLASAASADDENDELGVDNQVRAKKKATKAESKKRRRIDPPISDLSDSDSSSNESEKSRANTPRKVPAPAVERPGETEPIVINSEDDSDFEMKSPAGVRQKVRYISSGPETELETNAHGVNASQAERMVPGTGVPQDRADAEAGTPPGSEHEESDDSSSVSSGSDIDWLGDNMPHPMLIVKNEVDVGTGGKENSSQAGLAGHEEVLDVDVDPYQFESCSNHLEPIRRFDRIQPGPDSEQPSRSFGPRRIRAVRPDELDQPETRRAREEEEERLRRRDEWDQYLSRQPRQPGFVLDRDTENAALVAVDSGIAKYLKPHQEQGVEFMWKTCFETQSRAMEEEGGGCVLAHCMGLGKSLQVIALLHTIVRNPVLKSKFRSFLIIAPKLVVSNWVHEAKSWQRDIRSDEQIPIHVLSKTKVEDRAKALRAWNESGGIALIHYNLLLSLFPDSANAKQRLIIRMGQDVMDMYTKCILSPGPDIVVADEGHLLKNMGTKIFKLVNSIPTKRRIILSGTPMQNNLKEFYAMMELVKPKLFGTWPEFTNRFVNPILNGQFSTSLPEDVKLMKYRAFVLTKRSKGSVHRVPVSVLTQELPPKKEYTIGVKLTPQQIKFYNGYFKFLDRNGQERKLFRDYSVLTKIIAHPAVLKEPIGIGRRRTTKKRVPIDIEEVSDTYVCSEDEEYDRLQHAWFHHILSQPDVDFNNYEMSAKLVTLRCILKYCKQKGDKLLVFSQFLTALEQIENMLRKELSSIRYYRLDGNTSVKDRLMCMKNFNDPGKGIDVFLLSTRAASLGINLNAANHVVLFDASWNPAQDLQAIFRTYRYGQTKPVYVYRLIGQHTLEEDRIYNSQVVKLALASRVVDEKQIERHIAKNPEEMALVYKPYPETETEDEARAREEQLEAIVHHDPLLKQLVHDHPDLIHSIREHDSLLQDDEELTEEQQKLAMELDAHDNQIRTRPTPTGTSTGANDGQQPGPSGAPQRGTRGRGRGRPRGGRGGGVARTKAPRASSQNSYELLLKEIWHKLGQLQDSEQRARFKIMFEQKRPFAAEQYMKAAGIGLNLEVRREAYGHFKEAMAELIAMLKRLGVSPRFFESRFPPIPAFEPQQRSLIQGMNSPPSRRPPRFTVQGLQNALSTVTAEMRLTGQLQPPSPPPPPQ